MEVNSHVLCYAWCRMHGLQSALFSVITPTLALAGASYLFFPGYTLASSFGYVKDVASFFYWQNIGAGLMTVFPAMTYSLKRHEDEGHGGDDVSLTLSGGLLLSALGHMAVMGPMMVAGQGAGLLPWLAGAWAIVAAAGAAGIMGGRKRARSGGVTARKL